MPDPSEEKGLRLVRMEEPQVPHTPKPLKFQTKEETVADEKRDVRDFFTFGRIIFVLAAVITIAFLIWSGYLIRGMRREIGLPEPTASPAAQMPESTPLTPVTADFFQVTTISLGKVRFAIANGKRVGEGDLIEIKTANGPLTARVAGIEDGVVHFKCGGQIVDARLSWPTGTQK